MVEVDMAKERADSMKRQAKAEAARIKALPPRRIVKGRFNPDGGVGRRGTTRDFYADLYLPPETGEKF